MRGEWDAGSEGDVAATTLNDELPNGTTFLFGFSRIIVHPSHYENAPLFP